VPASAHASAASIACRALLKTARTPSPRSLPSIAVPSCSRMTVRSAPSRSRAFARKVASPLAVDLVWILTPSERNSPHCLCGD